MTGAGHDGGEGHPLFIAALHWHHQGAIRQTDALLG